MAVSLPLLHLSSVFYQLNTGDVETGYDSLGAFSKNGSLASPFTISIAIVLAGIVTAQLFSCSARQSESESRQKPHIGSD